MEEKALLKALDRIPFEQQNVCICFPFPGSPLQQCSWAGAAVYNLTYPTFIDFIHPTSYEAIRLVDREIACFFTLASYSGARFFSSEAQNLLQPILKKHFGDDVGMAETLDFPF